MLSPDLKDVEQDLSDTHNVLLNIGGFAESCLSAEVGRLDPPPAWLDDVDAVLVDCRAIATRWLDDRPQIIAPLVAAFATYSSTMDAAAETLARDEATAEDWERFLTALRQAAHANSLAARDVRKRIDDHHAQFSAAHAELRKVLQEAREAQDETQADVATIAAKLQEIYDRLAALNVGGTAAGMAGAQAMVKTVAEMSYAVLVEGSAEVPFLGIAATLFSVGNDIYDMVEGDAEIRSLLGEVAALLGKLEQDARLLAVTHALIAMLDDMNEAYIAAIEQVPRLNGYWDAEGQTIGEVLDGLKAHGNPQEMMALRTLPAAAKVWDRLGTTASAMAIPTAVAPKAVQLKVVIT